ncbi:MAG: hypothetical protein JW876_06885 [Candidatus Krumholzibacteriota bacterium]|nr:hypothetical protein [Candidatus Krumholzibacteriota bacterium]
MDTAIEDIRLLIDIVLKDREIVERKRSIEEAPARINQIDRLVDEMETQFEKSKGALKKLVTEKDRLDERIAGFRGKIVKHEEEKRLVKDNKQFRALLSEIEFLSRKIDEAETRILEIHEAMDVENNLLRETQRRIDDEKDALIEERDVLEKRLEENTSRLAVLEREKAAISGRLSDRVSRFYGRILDGRGDTGVANLVGDVCQGCFSRMPPQKAHEVRRNDRIITCEACGRILVSIENAE